MNRLRTRTTELVEARSIPDWWSELLVSAGNSSVFLTSEWLRTWLDSYGSAFQGKWVSFWCEERCVAGFLLLNRRSRTGPFPVRLGAFNTAAEDAEESPWVEYNDILCVSGFEQEVSDACITLLGENPWDQLYLNGYPENGVLSRLASSAARWHVETEWKLARYVDLTVLPSGGIDALLSSNTRSQMRRSSKIYAARGELSINAAQSVEQARQYLDELAKLHRDGWRRRGKEGGFRTAQFITFHKRLIESLWPVAGVSVLCATAGGSAFAYLYNFVHQGRVYFYQSGFAYEDDSKIKPGLVAHYLAMKHFVERGMTEYDFMAGDSRYKQSLANAERQLAWTRIERDNALVDAVRVARSLRNRLSGFLGRPERGGNPEAPE